VGEEEWNDVTPGKGDGMRALFITPTFSTMVLLGAWKSWHSDETSVFRYDITGAPRDAQILEHARKFNSDVIFYSSAVAGSGIPSVDTLKSLRSMAPLIHLCGDAADYPWYEPLLMYKKEECFDLQVTVDGAIAIPGIDMTIIMPADPRPFEGEAPDRDILCGFPGQCGQGHPRYDVLTPLVDEGLVTYRARGGALPVEISDKYGDYAHFLRRCKVCINFSHTGSGVLHHVKGRVVEAALGGAALLDMEASLTKEWVPKEYIFLYKDVEDAARIIKNMDYEDAAERAKLFQAYVSDNYNAEKSYKAMLERIGL